MVTVERGRPSSQHEALEFVSESGALYIGAREGEVPRNARSRRAGVRRVPGHRPRGNGIGVELLSFEEVAKLLTRYGSILELPKRIEALVAIYLK